MAADDLELVDGRRLRVLVASYLRSGPNDESLGAPMGPEVAFMGRSNVGKSSLLNVLLGTSLARVSRTPGRLSQAARSRCVCRVPAD